MWIRLISLKIRGYFKQGSIYLKEKFPWMTSIAYFWVGYFFLMVFELFNTSFIVLLCDILDCILIVELSFSFYEGINYWTRCYSINIVIFLFKMMLKFWGLIFPVTLVVHKNTDGEMTFRKGPLINPKFLQMKDSLTYPFIPPHTHSAFPMFLY